MSRLRAASVVLPLLGCVASGCFLFQSKTEPPTAGTASASAAAGTDASHGPGGTDADGENGSHGPGFIGPGPGGTDPMAPPPPTPTTQPRATAPTAPTAPAPTPSAGASAAPTAVASAAPALPTDIELRNDCPDTLRIFLGDKPHSSGGKETTVGGRSTVKEPLAADGTATVWILDGKGDGVASAHVEPTSKRVTIGIDCRSFHVD